MITGIDVSSHQGPAPDWRNSQVVAVKATQGITYRNPHWAAQVQGARATGARITHYHYPNISRDGRTEALRFLEVIRPQLREGDVLCLDWEWYDQQDDMPPATQPTARQEYVARQDQRAREYRDEFAAAIRAEAPDRRLILYCDTSIWKRVDRTSDDLDGLWIADYGAPAGSPRIQHRWLGHQWTDKPVDQNVWRFDAASDWDRWCVGDEVPQPDPQPEPPSEVTEETDGVDRHVPADNSGVYSDTLTLQRLQRAASVEVLTGSDYDHRYQAMASLRALGHADRISPPAGDTWVEHFREAWADWQRQLGHTGAAADGVPGRKSVQALAERVGLKFWDEDAPRVQDPPTVPADTLDRHEPAHEAPGVYTGTLTLQRLKRCADREDVDEDDYCHRYQAMATLRALGCAPRITPPENEGWTWSRWFQEAWKKWQQDNGFTGADADGRPGERSVWALCSRAGLSYWDADRKSDQPAFLAVVVSGRVASPVPGFSVSTPYGRRKQGLWTGKGYHTGHDYATGRTGVPVVAVRDGTVSVLESKALGAVAVLRADNGRFYWYCHLKRGSRATGPVKAGQVIGLVGMTGNTTGPHLHFEDNSSPSTWGTDREPTWGG